MRHPYGYCKLYRFFYIGPPQKKLYRTEFPPVKFFWLCPVLDVNEYEM